MSITHFVFDEGTKYGRMLRSFLTTAESSDDAFRDLRQVMIQMWNGADGSQDAHYDVIVKEFRVGGYDPTQGSPSADQLAMAHAMFQEFDSAYSKTSGDGAVSSVRSARDQMFDKYR